MADAGERLPQLRLLLFGPPGSGKGTQSSTLGQRLAIPAISTGDMLRQAVTSGSELGRKVETTLATGGLVDDGTMAELVGDRLARADARLGFILDGYPRTLAQATTLDSMLNGRAESLDAALFLEVPEDELVRRLSGRQRADDSEEVVRERLRVYGEKTRPLVEHYGRQGLLRRIDGNRPVSEVTAAILAALRAPVPPGTATNARHDAQKTV